MSQHAFVLAMDLRKLGKAADCARCSTPTTILWRPWGVHDLDKMYCGMCANVLEALASDGERGA